MCRASPSAPASERSMASRTAAARRAPAAATWIARGQRRGSRRCCSSRRSSCCLTRRRRQRRTRAQRERASSWRAPARASGLWLTTPFTSSARARWSARAARGGRTSRPPCARRRGRASSSATSPSSSSRTETRRRCTSSPARASTTRCAPATCGTFFRSGCCRPASRPPPAAHSARGDRLGRREAQGVQHRQLRGQARAPHPALAWRPEPQAARRGRPVPEAPATEEGQVLGRRRPLPLWRDDEEGRRRGV
mmetsp:Transcript_33393/g.107304  ORF Transcript_33393/g.107304 Transcript_33393/m.107304 type:complete len:252 (-) Transcript_33393:780-1535(-)